MNELITTDIIIAGCIFIIGMAIGALCVNAINIKGQSGCMTGIITTTSNGDLCRSGRGKPGAEPPIPRGLPAQRTTPERPVCQINACCLICARGEPEGGTVLCTYSREAYREGWYCGLFMQRDIETGLE